MIKIGVEVKSVTEYSLVNELKEVNMTDLLICAGLLGRARDGINDAIVKLQDKIEREKAEQDKKGQLELGLENKKKEEDSSAA